MELTLIVLVLYLSWCDADQGGSPLHRSTPAYIVLGTLSGQIWRCLLHDPNDCELFYNDTSPVLDMVAHGENLFFSIGKGEIIKCNWQKQCAVLYRGYALHSLAVAGEFLYAGGDSNVVLRFNLNIPHSSFKVYKTYMWSRGIYHNDQCIYVGIDHGLLRCSNDFESNCQVLEIPVRQNEFVTSVSGWGDIIVVSTTSTLLSFNSTSHHTFTHRHLQNLIFYSRSRVTQFDDLYKMAIFKGIMYVIYDNKNIAIGRWDEILTHIVEYDYALTSMSFIYATHHTQGYLDGDSCSQGSLSTVFQYQEERRAMVEVSVAGGKLVDARGVPVDTRTADAGYSGPAAVFAMAPGGQILASNAHRSGLVHITSFFAGKPVAGAGEMIVEDGVIKRIVACSEHYWADVELNRQVMHELYSRGYSRAGDIKLEECEFTCDRLTPKG